MVNERFQNIKFGNTPFIGIGEARRIHLSTHPYLSNIPAGVSKGITPWNGNPATLVGLQKNGTIFAVLSIDGKQESNMPKIDLFSTTLSKPTYRIYNVHITAPPLPETYGNLFETLDFELRLETVPQIFSMIPLEIVYNIDLDRQMSRVPIQSGGRLMMKGYDQRSMNGQIHVPAGQVVDLGPILKIMVKKQKLHATGPYGKEALDSHLITRNVSLGIRKRLYG